MDRLVCYGTSYCLFSTPFLLWMVSDYLAKLSLVYYSVHIMYTHPLLHGAPIDRSSWWPNMVDIVIHKLCNTVWPNLGMILSLPLIMSSCIMYTLYYYPLHFIIFLLSLFLFPPFCLFLSLSFSPFLPLSLSLLAPEILNYEPLSVSADMW